MFKMADEKWDVQLIDPDHEHRDERAKGFKEGSEVHASLMNGRGGC